jgi:hypothetical protein
MSGRSQLADLIAASAPETWEIIPHPTRLRPFDNPAKPVAIVVEQRAIQSGKWSPDGVSIPVETAFAVWVIVDGARGADAGPTEDDLEAAAETMIRILEPLAAEVWDGTAERGSYDDQKPAYQFTIRAAGALTQEVQQ